MGNAMGEPTVGDMHIDPFIIAFYFYFMGDLDFDMGAFIMSYGTWETYQDARGIRDSDQRGKTELLEVDFRRCTRCIIMWHLSTPIALGNFALNHFLNERYFCAHVLGPSPLTLFIYFVFILPSGSTLRGVL